jgi:hypothetical protein
MIPHITLATDKRMFNANAGSPRPAVSRKDADAICVEAGDALWP